MGRYSVLEGVKQEAELLLRRFLSKAEGFEHTVLQVTVVDTQRAAAQFHAVEHDIVGLGTYLAGVGLQILNILVHRSGKGMMHRLVAARFVVIFKLRELGYPQKFVLILVGQPQTVGNFATQSAERIEDDTLVGIGHHQ